MVPTSAAAVLLSAAVAALMAMALHLTAPAAAAAGPPRSIGLPGCSTTCGDVSVPYPFGFGTSGCYWPGLNLTCDTSHDPPRLLLGDGTLRVTDIFLQNGTVRVMRTGSVINTTGDFTSDGWNASFGRGFMEHGYFLSYDNEFVLVGCNVVLRILADVGKETPTIIGGCASFCTVFRPDLAPFTYEDEWGLVPCTGTMGCCRASVSVSGQPNEVQARWLYSGNHTEEQHDRPVNVFVMEPVDRNKQLTSSAIDHEVPIVLYWNVKLGLPERGACDDDVSRILCKSQHSECSGSHQSGGYRCRCEHGYDGNPYLAGGCQEGSQCVSFEGDEVEEIEDSEQLHFGERRGR